MVILQQLPGVEERPWNFTKWLYDLHTASLWHLRCDEMSWIGQVEMGREGDLRQGLSKDFHSVGNVLYPGQPSWRSEANKATLPQIIKTRTLINYLWIIFP